MSRKKGQKKRRQIESGAQLPSLGPRHGSGEISANCLSACSKMMNAPVDLHRPTQYRYGTVSFQKGALILRREPSGEEGGTAQTSGFKRPRV